MHTNVRTESKLPPQKICPYTSKLITLTTCSFMFPRCLNLFLKYSYRFLNRYELWNIHQGRAISQNIASTHHINKRGKNLEYLLDGHIFYPISTRSPSIKEILEHNSITDKKHIQADSLCLWQWNFPKRFHRISLHVHSQYTLKNKETHTPNTLIRINTNGTILTRITDLSCFLTALRKTKVT